MHRAPPGSWHAEQDCAATKQTCDPVRRCVPQGREIEGEWAKQPSAADQASWPDAATFHGDVMSCDEERQCDAC